MEIAGGNLGGGFHIGNVLLIESVVSLAANALFGEHAGEIVANGELKNLSFSSWIGGLLGLWWGSIATAATAASATRTSATKQNN